MKRALALAALVAAAGCAPHRHKEISQYSVAGGRPPVALADELAILDQSCGENERATAGLCESDGARVVWFERREAAGVARWAYAGGELAFYEERAGRAVDAFGNEPACHPVMEPACGALDKIRCWSVTPPGGRAP